MEGSEGVGLAHRGGGDIAHASPWDDVVSVMWRERSD